MQTILGAGGQIANELARELRGTHGQQVRLVSRRPRAVSPTDQLAAADLLDLNQTRAAVEGSETVYFTAGLPADTALWQAVFPTMLLNALIATRAAGARFVYFDNTYMYPQDDRVLTEATRFAPVGPKARVRAQMADMVLDEMAREETPVLIGRAPEFYGPGRTQSFTHTLVLDRLIAGRRPLVPVRDDRERTLIWTPDASRALALLGNTPDAYGHTWHLPTPTERPTYRTFVDMAAGVWDNTTHYRVLPYWLISAAGAFSRDVREIRELLPRYRHHNRFDSSAFATRFPDFTVTSYRDGLELIRADHGRQRAAASPETQ